jgi:predicted transcriptional regulator
MIDFACKQFDMREIIKCSLGLTRAELRIFEHMLKSAEPLTSEEIAKQLKLDLSTVQRAVKKLHEKTILRRMQMNLEGGGYVFEYQLSDKRQIRKVIMATVQNWTLRVEDELEGW